MPEPLDATLRADLQAALLRRWYEQNRETWWSRCRFSGNQRRLDAGAADAFALRLARAARMVADLADDELIAELNAQN